MTATDPLLQPFRLRGLTLRNRVLSTAHAPGYAEGGRPALRYQRYHEEKAKGGLALTMFGGSSNVALDSAAVFGGQINAGDDGIIPYFLEFSERIHRHGAALMCQLTHMGRRTVWHADNWLATIAPSRVREPQHRSYPRAMEPEDIRRVVACYAAAARRCAEGGLDGCEILTHGHLIDQFLSPLTNRRNDGYGGNLANRMRFGLEVLAAVRKAVPDSFVVGLRLGGGEDRAGGLDEDDCLAIAEAHAASGCIDYLSLVFGRAATDLELAEKVIPGMDAPLAPFLARVQRFKRATSLPVFHACRINDLATARHAIREGIVDMIGMTRAHLADPQLVNTLVAGAEEELRPCVGAGYCIDSLFTGGAAFCAHNVATGRETELDHEIDAGDGPRRHVVVIGAGPAGLEAARVSALRGHRVTLLEAGAETGGQLLLAARGAWRRDIIGIRDWLARQVERLGIEVQTGRLVEADEVLALSADVVVVATGGVPDLGDSAFDDGAPAGAELAVSTWDVLANTVSPGATVLVYDVAGRHEAASCINHLCDHGSVVELVTPDRMALAEVGGQNFPIYLKRLHRQGVRINADSRLVSIRRAGNRLLAGIANLYGGASSERAVDQVVIENGTLPNDDLYFALKPHSLNLGEIDQARLLAGAAQLANGETPANPAGRFLLFRVGDAVSSRNLHASMLDARRVCRAL